MPKPLVDILHIEDASNMFPLPEFTSTLSNTSSNIPEKDLKLIQANEKALYDEILVQKVCCSPVLGIIQLLCVNFE